MPNTERTLTLFNGEFYAVEIGQRPGTAEPLVGYRVTNKQTDVVEEFATYLPEANKIAEDLNQWAASTFEVERTQNARVVDLN